ncbi:MAG: hypothetical protein ABIJ41_02795 [Candidatus Omnitrophota bacterium]
MILKILGWIWILSGILWLIKPEYLRNRLKKKSYKQVRGWIFVLALAVGVLLMNAAGNLHGVLAKFIFILGLIAVFKGFFFLKAKAAVHIYDWFLKQPMKFFRLWAGIEIVIGALFLSI